MESCYFAVLFICTTHAFQVDCNTKEQRTIPSTIRPSEEQCRGSLSVNPICSPHEETFVTERHCESKKKMNRLPIQPREGKEGLTASAHSRCATISQSDDSDIVLFFMK